MKHLRLLSLITTLFIIGSLYEVGAQNLGVKTNLIYWSTTTPNFGIELKASDRYTLSASLGYNAFDYPNYTSSNGEWRNPKLHHWLVAAECKYWLCRSFERHYLSLSTMGGRYNAGGIPFISFLNHHRYEGWGVGAGLNYGYQWPLGSRWGIETSFGVGYMFLAYDKFKSKPCSVLEKHSAYHYIGITKLSVSFIYYIH